MFVLEEHKEPELKEEERESTRFFRLKKFTASVSKGKTTYSEVASQEFEETSPHLTQPPAHRTAGRERSRRRCEVRAAVPADDGPACGSRRDRQDPGRRGKRSGERRLDAVRVQDGGTRAGRRNPPRTAVRARPARPCSSRRGSPWTQRPKKSSCSRTSTKPEAPTTRSRPASDHFVLQRIKPGAGPTATYVDKTNKFKEKRQQLHPQPHLADRGRGEQRRAKST